MTKPDLADFYFAITELQGNARETFGLFHDAAQGWIRFSQQLEELVEQSMLQGATRDQALTHTLIHGKGKTPETGTELHRSTLGESLERVAPHGPNERFLGNMCLVSIFSFWEHRTRSLIASALRIPDASVKSNLFGDMRHLRHCLLHCGGIADNRVAGAKVLKWFGAGDRIIIDREKLHQVVLAIDDMPDGLVTEGFDPTR